MSESGNVLGASSLRELSTSSRNRLPHGAEPRCRFEEQEADRALLATAGCRWYRNGPRRDDAGRRMAAGWPAQRELCVAWRRRERQIQRFAKLNDTREAPGRVFRQTSQHDVLELGRNCELAGEPGGPA